MKSLLVLLLSTAYHEILYLRPENPQDVLTIRFHALAVVYKYTQTATPCLTGGGCSTLPMQRKPRQLNVIHVVVQPRLGET